jgi:hypothetical protein
MDGAMAFLSGQCHSMDGAMVSLAWQGGSMECAAAFLSCIHELPLCGRRAIESRPNPQAGKRALERVL